MMRMMSATMRMMTSNFVLSTFCAPYLAFSPFGRTIR